MSLAVCDYKQHCILLWTSWRESGKLGAMKKQNQRKKPVGKPLVEVLCGLKLTSTKHQQKAKNMLTKAAVEMLTTVFGHCSGTGKENYDVTVHPCPMAISLKDVKRLRVAAELASHGLVKVENRAGLAWVKAWNMQ